MKLFPYLVGLHLLTCAVAWSQFKTTSDSASAALLTFFFPGFAELGWLHWAIRHEHVYQVPAIVVLCLVLFEHTDKRDREIKSLTQRMNNFRHENDRLKERNQKLSEEPEEALETERVI